MSNLKVGIIGYGYWGPNLLRNFKSLKECSVKTVVDLNFGRLRNLSLTDSTLSLQNNAEAVILDPEIDAVVIATPVSTHYPLAKAALEAGKHVLVEKPMTSNMSHAKELVDLAESKNLILMVDHTFLYTPAVEKIKSLIDSGDLGKLQYFDSVRINLGLFQNDVSVVWDLAAHDISILSFITPERPVSVNSTGKSHLTGQKTNISYLSLNYPSDFISHFHVSWISPVKIRQILIGGDKKMVLFNDLEISEKVKIYDTGFSQKTDEERNATLVDYRVGDIFVPKVAMKEALSNMAEDFKNSIFQKKKPRSSAEIGLHVVEILDAAERSMAQGGAEVKI